MSLYLNIPFTRSMFGIEYNSLFRRFQLCFKPKRESLSALKRNVDRHPEDADSKISLACALYDRGNLAEAEKLCYDALRILPPDDTLIDDTIAVQSNAHVHLLLGCIWRDMGRKDAAVSEWQQASRLDRFGIGDEARKLLAAHLDERDNLFRCEIVLMNEKGDFQEPFSIRDFDEASKTFTRMTRNLKKNGFYGVGFVKYGVDGRIEQVAVECSKNKLKGTEFRYKFFEMIKSR